MISAVKLLTEKYNPLVKILCSILVGTVGTILVIGFLSTFLRIFTLAKLTPFVIALNGLIAGYYLLEKTRDTLRRKHVVALIVAAAYVLFASMILKIFFLYRVGEYVLIIDNLGIYLILGIICTQLGAILAIKYLKIS